jgi:hypothetical protein
MFNDLISSILNVSPTLIDFVIAKVVGLLNIVKILLSPSLHTTEDSIVLNNR